MAWAGKLHCYSFFIKKIFGYIYIYIYTHNWRKLKMSSSARESIANNIFFNTCVDTIGWWSQKDRMEETQ